MILKLGLRSFSKYIASLQKRVSETVGTVPTLMPQKASNKKNVASKRLPLLLITKEWDKQALMT